MVSHTTQHPAILSNGPRKQASSQRQTPSLFGLAELLLKDREQLFRLMREHDNLSTLLPSLLLLTLAGTVPMGIVMGSYSGGWQVLFAAIKVPLILLVTLAICQLPFWTWGKYFRARLQMGQVAGITLSAMATTSLLLLGLCPLLWLVVGGGTAKYHVAILTVVGVFLLSGLGGVRVLFQGLIHVASPADPKQREGLLKMAWVWMGLYTIVGMQVVWILRPFLSHPWAKHESVVFFRSLDSNVYQAIWKTLMGVLGL
ncbi:MAG: hypothetical protein EP343_15985 [Deltaproteobacteria bacterium]|nr:MAG: hypothetical protein EP343_15985 [Deltaproteobacteria bacterium]